MEIGRVGNHLLSACPFCDLLLHCIVKDGKVGDGYTVLDAQYHDHLQANPRCQAERDAQHSLTETTAKCAEAVTSRIERIRKIRMDVLYMDTDCQKGSLPDNRMVHLIRDDLPWLCDLIIGEQETTKYTPAGTTTRNPSDETSSSPNG